MRYVEPVSDVGVESTTGDPQADRQMPTVTHGNRSGTGATAETPPQGGGPERWDAEGKTSGFPADSGSGNFQANVYNLVVAGIFF